MKEQSGQKGNFSWGRYCLYIVKRALTIDAKDRKRLKSAGSKTEDVTYSTDSQSPVAAHSEAPGSASALQAFSSAEGSRVCNVSRYDPNMCFLKKK